MNHHCNKEISNIINSRKHLIDTERLKIREDEIFDKLFQKEEGFTFTKLKEIRRLKQNEYNLKTFADHPKGVHGHELPKFSSNENTKEFWKLQDGYVENPKHKSQFESNINDPKYCNLIVKYLKKTKKKLKKLIEINIEPVLKSFVDWEKISKLDKLLQGTEDNSSANSFITQFENRKLIVKKLIEIIEDNINIVNEYINKYLPKNKIGYEVILEVEDNEIEKSLNLGEKYKLDINEYIKDAGLIYSFKLMYRS